MTSRSQALIPIFIAAVIIGSVGLLTLPSEIKLQQVEFPRGVIKVNDIPLEVQIADTKPTRVRGLMFQDELPFDQGMLFVFPESGLHSLWMLNMQFPLDMIWFDSDGAVIHIEKNVPPCVIPIEIAAGCPSFVPSGEATYILEVTSGFIEQYNITKDSILEIISI